MAKEREAARSGVMRDSGTWLAACALALALTSCSSGNGTGQVSVHLTDAPGPYDHVYVDVTGVSLHLAASNGGVPENEAAEPPSSPKGGPGASDDQADEGLGWISVSVPRTTIDLLSLQNGVELPLGSATVPAGAYDDERLVVAGATVVVGGQSYALKVPSGAERGIQIHAPFTVPAGAQADLLLDFDAAASIHQEGNGNYIMQPVLRVKAVR